METVPLLICEGACSRPAPTPTPHRYVRYERRIVNGQPGHARIYECLRCREERSWGLDANRFGAGHVHHSA